MDEKNIHTGHRQRMKESALDHGIDAFNDHQVLELLLFYGIPNGDTNPAAHRLIERFGSLRGVLEADYDELIKVKGIAGNAASLIKFSQMLAGRYLRSACFDDNKTPRFADTEAFRRYYEGVFLGAKDERLRAMAIDDDLYMIAEGEIFEGTIGKVDISARKIVDFAVRSSCSRIVLAHNHPNGIALPSGSDLAATEEIIGILSKLEIRLEDHIIVGRTGSCSLHSTHKEIWSEKF